MNFREELTLERIQMRVMDLCQEIRIRGGMCQVSADAIKNVEVAIAPVYEHIRATYERLEEAIKVERERLAEKALNSEQQA